MFGFINRLLRSFFTGCFVLLIAAYLFVEKAISFVFYETSVPLSAVAIQNVEWSDRDYGLGDRQITIEAEFRNNSPLKLINLELDYGLFDCPAATAPRERCRPVQGTSESASVDTPAGFRGRFANSFIVQRMAAPQGVLVLDTRLTSATGVQDK